MRLGIDMRRFLFLLLFLGLIGCAPTRQAAIPIPTLALLPSAYRSEDAERTARLFLQAWVDGDLDGMFSLLSFNSQEATPRDEFRTLYQDAHNTMTLHSLSFTANSMTRPRDELAIFNYDVTFQTEMLGEFSDRARDLQIVVDTRADEWRVAWTPADIFAQMVGGGRLRLDPTVPNRANIYDSAGRALADQNGRVVLLNVTRQNIPQYAECLNALAAALDEPAADVQAELEARPADWLVEVGIIEAQIYFDHYQALESLCAATFDDRPARRYPNGTVAPHILGTVGYPNEGEVEGVEAAGFRADSILGRSGVERSWDETLRGQPAATLSIANPTGSVTRELARSPARPGESVWLTIDSAFQAEVQLIVADAYTQAKDAWAPDSKGAAVVVIDVNTGAIRALVSYPTYDINAYTPFPEMGREQAQQIVVANNEDLRRPELNRPTQGIYPLGSVMKTISAAAAADSGVYALDERYTCTGIWSRDITRYDWFRPGHGTITLPQSLTYSCNPYYYEVGFQMFQANPGLLSQYAQQLGFGGLSGMTDIAEAPGLIPDPEWLRVNYGATWTFSDEVNMSIGQGYVQVTPLQVARWFAAIANGGNMPTPYLVEQAGLLGDRLRPVHEAEMTPTGLRPEVLATIQSGLCAVTTDPFGTAEFVFENSPLQTIGVCGKTGTAQDEPRNSHAWFASYAPRTNPEIVVVVIVENAGEGSGVAAPIARQVLEAYFDLTP
jgi:penicillin-binding protein 2